MKKWEVVLMVLGVLTVLSASMASGDVVAYDQNNGGNLTRWAADGSVVWTNPVINGFASNLEVGPNGRLYLGGWTYDKVFVFDPATGDRLTDVADGVLSDRVYDLTFGNDFDGDGIQDMYVASGTDKQVRVYMSSDGYSNSTMQTFSTLANATYKTTALDFGPDVNGDGIGDLWVVDGEQNDATNRVFVVDGSTGAEISNFGLPEIRTPKDLVIGSDGRVYITNSARNQVSSYALDGTDVKWDGVGISNVGDRYPRQIHESADGLWYTANRFAGSMSEVPYALGSSNGAITVHTAGYLAWYDLFVETAGADYTAVTTVIPEPATLALLSLGSLVLLRKKR